MLVSIPQYSKSRWSNSPIFSLIKMNYFNSRTYLLELKLFNCQLTHHHGFLDHWNSQKSISNVWQHFSGLLDEGIPKIWKKLNSHDGFLSYRCVVGSLRWAICEVQQIDDFCFRYVFLEVHYEKKFTKLMSFGIN